ncbi:DNA-binding transcriptional regulator, AcrR family [Brevibacterium sandarakinum]|uniref:DNA-binding transcriptional regulator, AcrR family n=1 Tax=Brevibacterium sandarakinum TaxID=629680 RepID=A0A1H1NXX8_BRESA|nr:TetR family transcriptional regulator [Brevibacterium sandarakinum]SDS03836.1 DNA-binding transcriptional regulator, AcrR family [Brevibacterium sandarakinum]
MAPRNTTRDLLLASAREEFADHGIAGARVDAIAARAGVNKERIYGYFGSKEKLFDAVVTEAKAEHAQGLGLPEGDLAEYVGRLYDFHRNHPTLRRLMLWEALYYGDRPVPDDDARTRSYEAKANALAQALGRDADEQTAATLMTLIGMAAWPHTMPQLTRFLLPDATDEHRHEVMRARVVEFARQGLRKA